MLLSKKSKKGLLVFLMFFVAACMALVNLRVGAPQVNIDDFSLYEGGFLVWFGNAPPQHAYLECWINGLASMVTFLVKGVLLAGAWDALSLEFVCRAYSDFYYQPDGYYAVYRFVIVLFNLATAWLVYLIAHRCSSEKMAGFAPLLALFLYLFSYNTFWCNLAGRPDTLVAFFAMLGMYFYLQSDYRDDKPFFWLAAVAFGVAAGLKLHGAFFAIFAAFDLLRAKGIRPGFRSVLILTVISVLFFMVADGSLLFDPLKYIKARMETYVADHSGYLEWGQQFVAVLRGSGWLIAPLTLVSWFAIRDVGRKSSMRSIVFMAFCWLVLFCSIRQLRAYWMLPALPVFYIAAVAVLDRMKKVGSVLAIIVVIIFLFQSFSEVRNIHATPYNELRNWVEANLSDHDSAYLIGYSVLRVPRSEKVNGFMKNIIETSLLNDATKYGFTYRHLKYWEELSAFRLQDMLIAKKNCGYNIIDYVQRRVNFDNNDQFLEQFNYFIVQDKFVLENRAVFDHYLEKNFSFVVKLVGEGGRGYGLDYKIYKRNQVD